MRELRSRATHWPGLCIDDRFEQGPSVAGGHSQAKALCDALRHVKDVRRVVHLLRMPPPCINLNAAEWLQLHHTTQALLHMREVLQVKHSPPTVPFRWESKH